MACFHLLISQTSFDFTFIKCTYFSSLSNGAYNTLDKNIFGGKINKTAVSLKEMSKNDNDIVLIHTHQHHTLAEPGSVST